MESNLKAAGIDLQDRRPLSRTRPGLWLVWPRLMFTSHKPQHWMGGRGGGPQYAR